MGEVPASKLWTSWQLSAARLIIFIEIRTPMATLRTKFNARAQSTSKASKTADQTQLQANASCFGKKA